MTLQTCVDPAGRFRYGLHQPAYSVENRREDDPIAELGRFDDGRAADNRINLPPGDIEEPAGAPVYEIRNPFPFRGATFIIKSAADRTAADPSRIALPARPETSLSAAVSEWLGDAFPDGVSLESLLPRLPRPIRLSLAVNGTDPRDLIPLAESSCQFVKDAAGRPVGLAFEDLGGGGKRPRITDEALFEALGNNPDLPDAYKEVMVLRPGVQGTSEIVGQWGQAGGDSHVFEYLRRNSYIPWGHYAANMANDAVRYRAADLSSLDVTGMRHLYYQRTYLRVAADLGIHRPPGRETLSGDDLEALRSGIVSALADEERRSRLKFTATLWGWNFGFGYAGNGYRLHASHQQVHQQYALLPRGVPEAGPDADAEEMIPEFACGDLMTDFARRYRRETGADFFEAYLSAIRGNRRMDGDDRRPADLVVREDDGVILFVPKAQTSQWELQMMPIRPVGNVLEADPRTRAALDRCIRVAIQTLERMGARMVTMIECSRRFDDLTGPGRLIYSFLPKLPWSPGAFTEAQLRWINGHYPEDFAVACRSNLEAGESSSTSRG